MFNRISLLVIGLVCASFSVSAQASFLGHCHLEGDIVSTGRSITTIGGLLYQRTAEVKFTKAEAAKGSHDKCDYVGKTKEIPLIVLTNKPDNLKVLAELTKDSKVVIEHRAFSGRALWGVSQGSDWWLK